jgi:hypothetical protein
MLKPRVTAKYAIIWRTKADQAFRAVITRVYLSDPERDILLFLVAYPVLVCIVYRISIRRRRLLVDSKKCSRAFATSHIINLLLHRQHFIRIVLRSTVRVILIMRYLHVILVHPCSTQFNSPSPKQDFDNCIIQILL